MKYFKMKKERQERALVRREKNVADYNAGKVGTLNVPEGVDVKELLKAKLKLATEEVASLKKALSK